MSMRRKVETWAALGLINDQQAQAILAHEAVHKTSSFGRWLSGAAFFAILLGVLSIIGANWADIPGQVKIIVHLLLNLMSAVWIWRTAEGSLKREIAVFVFSGLVLTMIALTGQVYQLQGTLAGALSLWMMLITPVVFVFSRDLWTGLPWMLAFLTTICVAITEYLDDLPHELSIFYGIFVLIYLPLALMADGKLEIFQRLRPNYAHMFLNIGVVLFAISVTGASFVWYDSNSSNIDHGMSLCYVLMALLALILLAVHYCLMKRRRPEQVVPAGYALSAGCIILITLPMLSFLPSGDLMVYLSFIVAWVLFGWYGQVTDKVWLVRLSVTFISLRIFAIYCELSNTLLDTGIALIIGGFVALALIYIARKIGAALSAQRNGREHA